MKNNLEDLKQEMMMEEAIASAELAGADTQELNELVRDLTKTMPIPVAKSYAKKRIQAFVASELSKVKEGILERVNGERLVEVKLIAPPITQKEIYGLANFHINSFNQGLDTAQDIINKAMGD